MKRILIISFACLAILIKVDAQVSPRHYLAGTFPDEDGLIKAYPFYNKWIFVKSVEDSLLIGRIESVIKKLNKTKLLNVKKRFAKHKQKREIIDEVFYAYRSYLLRKVIYRFYKFNRAHMYRHPLGFPVYRGVLRMEKFNSCTDIEKYSYLAGAFLMNGYKEDGHMKYRFVNSASKVLLVDSLLKATGNKIIEFKIYEESVPTIVDIKFEPTNKLMNFLKKEIEIRQNYKTNKVLNY